MCHSDRTGAGGLGPLTLTPEHDILGVTLPCHHLETVGLIRIDPKGNHPRPIDVQIVDV